MNKNSIGREIPVPGVELFGGPFQKTPYLPRESGIPSPERKGKIIDSLEEAIIRSGLKDGMTISFHHHFRGGDKVLNKVMSVIAGMGVKDLTIAPSSLLNHHSPIIEHVKNGVISKYIYLWHAWRYRPVLFPKVVWMSLLLFTPMAVVPE